MYLVCTLILIFKFKLHVYVQASTLDGDVELLCRGEGTRTCPHIPQLPQVLSKVPVFSVSVYVCVCACVYVRERKRASESESVTPYTLVTFAANTSCSITQS